MPNPKTKIRMFHETIEDLRNNQHAKEYFAILRKLIRAGHELEFYRSGDEFGEPSTTIRDVKHLANFIGSYKFNF
jgi:hypothetical protein